MYIFSKQQTACFLISAAPTIDEMLRQLWYFDNGIEYQKKDNYKLVERLRFSTKCLVCKNNFIGTFEM